MIREIFVPLLDSAADQTALDAAMAMAKAHGAHVSALVTLTHPMPVVTEFGYVPVELTQQQLEQSRADAEKLAANARARLARETVSSEVRLTDAMFLWSEQTAALHAIHADISVLGGRDPAQASPRLDLTFRSLLSTSGRPVLFMPLGATLSLPARRVVLAWKPTREATRALHDALPLLGSDSEIDVLMIDPLVTEQGHGEQPGADIAKHLARHGLRVNVKSMPGEGRSDGANLLRHVQEAGADLLVMGGYGHARWREFVLGGATRSVLEGARTPVLFSH
jgi:nucleotide-binding universal stress UspA family protein